MKKIFIIMMIIAVAAIFAVPTFATIEITNAKPATVAGSPFTPSQSVVISAASSTTAYVATSAHQSAASGPGYEYQIDSTYNGIMKKPWANQAVADWPDVVTDATTSVQGFNP